MQYYNLKMSKRGVVCNNCSQTIPKGINYFVYFNFDKSKMAYPLTQKICLECAEKSVNQNFLDYLKQLCSAIQKNIDGKKIVIKGVESEEKVAG